MNKKVVSKKNNSVLKKSKKSNSISSGGKKIYELFFHPKEFLKNVENEKWSVGILTYLALSLIAFLISMGIALISISLNFEVILSFFAGLSLKLILNFVFAVLLAGLFYSGTRIFKSKGKYVDILKPVAYALVIGVVYAIISSVILAFLPIDNSILENVQEAQDIEVLKLAYKQYIMQPGALIAFILILIALIHEFIFCSMGIARFHKLSQGKAGASIILSIIGFIALMMLILSLLSIAIS
ncbi:MAG: Yip1 family protein [Nanoarchaeota archaeon]|nr:Yip1 family protein [Nanoarchaeota archaeon]